MISNVMSMEKNVFEIQLIVSNHKRHVLFVNITELIINVSKHSNFEVGNKSEA